MLIAAAHAQNLPPKVWDIPLGGTISALPSGDYVDPACGTDGGPPGRALASFAEFAACPRDERTGLHEIWFRYDDEMEYIARARHSEIMMRQYEANSFAGQPMISSLLIDDRGVMQGYRVVTDSHLSSQLRIDAYGLGDMFKGIAGMGIPCRDMPPAPGERPVNDSFVKEICERDDGGLVTRIESRRYYKPGQFAVDPNDNRVTDNLFESSARLEVFRPPAAAR